MYSVDRNDFEFNNSKNGLSNISNAPTPKLFHSSSTCLKMCFPEVKNDVARWIFDML